MQLPENPGRYFKNTPKTVLLPISKLRPLRRRSEGLSKARRAMELAYDGKIGRRDPISVRKNPDGSFTITDGNSTYAIAKENGWKRLPAVVQESQSLAEKLFEALT